MTIIIEPEDGDSDHFRVESDSAGLDIIVGMRYDNGPDRSATAPAFTIRFENSRDAIVMAREILREMGEE